MSVKIPTLKEVKETEKALWVQKSKDILNEMRGLLTPKKPLEKQKKEELMN